MKEPSCHKSTGHDIQSGPQTKLCSLQENLALQWESMEHKLSLEWTDFKHMIFSKLSLKVVRKWIGYPCKHNFHATHPVLKTSMSNPGACSILALNFADCKKYLVSKYITWIWYTKVWSVISAHFKGLCKIKTAVKLKHESRTAPIIWIRAAISTP